MKHFNRYEKIIYWKAPRASFYCFLLYIKACTWLFVGIVIITKATIACLLLISAMWRKWTAKREDSLHVKLLNLHYF